MTAHLLCVKDSTYTGKGSLFIPRTFEADLFRMCSQLDTPLVKGIKYPHTTAPLRSRDKYGRYEMGLNCS